MKSAVQDEAWTVARAHIGTGRLSIIMPAYRLGHSIAENLQHVHRVFSGHIPLEIIPVDDGSDDDTRQEIERMAAQLPEVNAVYIAENAGKGAALRRGFEASSGTHVLLLDGDLDLPPEQVSNFFDIMARERADVVIGSKRHPESQLHYPWYRVLSSNVYYVLIKLLVGLPVKDTQTGIKLFKREVLDWVLPRMLVKRFAFDLELLSIAHSKGFRVAEAPITLEFHGGAGCLRPTTVRAILNDTLAVFYRLRLLRYYDRIQHTRLPSPPPLVSIAILPAAPPTPVRIPPSGGSRAGLQPAPHGSPPRRNPRPASLIRRSIVSLVRRARACSWPRTGGDQGRALQRAHDPTVKMSLADPRQACIQALHRQSYPHFTILPANADCQPPTTLRKADRCRPATMHQAPVTDPHQILAFLREDTVPEDGWLRQALVYFSDDSVAAVTGPATLSRGASRLSESAHRILASRFVSGKGRRRHTPTIVQPIDEAPVDNLLVRRDLWERQPGSSGTINGEMYYDPRVLVRRAVAPLFLPHLRSVARAAFRQGRLVRCDGSGAFRSADALPAVGLLGLLLGCALSPAVAAVRPVLLALAALYSAVTFLAVHRFTRPLMWLVTWCGLVLTHLTQAVTFLAGLLQRPRRGLRSL